MRIKLFIKRDKPTAEEVIRYLEKYCKDFTVFEGKTGEEFPRDLFNGTQDILISYLSPWIIPPQVLRRTKLWNINFHPGSPEYPGIGCFNFAIYNKEKFYGVTAHLMNKKVDNGRIISVKRFPLLKSESVYSLSIKSYRYMLILFFEVMNSIFTENTLPACNEIWKRRPYRRKELEALCKIAPNMKKNEVARRIKAATYPNMPGAYVDISGYRFEYNPNR